MTIIERLEATEGTLKVSELANLFNMDVNAMYRHIRLGNIPSIRFGDDTIRLDAKQIAQWLRDQLSEQKRTQTVCTHDLAAAVGAHEYYLANKARKAGNQ